MEDPLVNWYQWQSANEVAHSTVAIVNGVRHEVLRVNNDGLMIGESILQYANTDPFFTSSQSVSQAYFNEMVRLMAEGEGVENPLVIHRDFLGFVADPECRACTGPRDDGMGTNIWVNTRMVPNVTVAIHEFAHVICQTNGSCAIHRLQWCRQAGHCKPWVNTYLRLQKTYGPTFESAARKQSDYDYVVAALEAK